MTKTGWTAIIILIVAVAGAFFWWTASKTPTADKTGDASSPVGAQGTDASSNTGAGGSADSSVSPPSVPLEATVTYDGNSFSPSTVTIAAGGTVTFTDTSASGMWVASDVHPAHAQYDGTSRSQHCASGYAGPKPFDQCAAGTSYRFVFGRAGAFGYHNHLNADATGVVIVIAQ